MNQKLITIIVNIFFTIYLLFALFTLLLLFVNPNFIYLFVFLFASLMAWGMRKKAAWILPASILLSAGNIVTVVLTASFDIASLIGLCLSLFQLYFFSQRNVRKYFGVKGTFLF